MENMFFEKCQNIILESLNSFTHYQNVQETLSHHYHTQRSSHHLTKEQILVYCATRLPATYHVIKRCLLELPDDFVPQKILDLGAGPLTGLLAFLDFYKNPLFSYTAIESHPLMNEIAHGFTKDLHFPIQPLLHCRDIEDYLDSSETYDFVMASYVLGEIKEQALEKIVKLIIKATDHFGLIILPGTPLDFEILLKIRTYVLEQGGNILSPCGTEGLCPLAQEKKRWCHFATHVLRSKTHKNIKKGTLPYEYEKYTYLLFSKKSDSDQKKTHRILSQPLHRKGHVVMELCSETGLSIETISKKTKELYKKAQKLHWGGNL